MNSKTANPIYLNDAKPLAGTLVASLPDTPESKLECEAHSDLLISSAVPCETEDSRLAEWRERMTELRRG